MVFLADVKTKMDLEGGASNQLEVPSKVTDRKVVFMPLTKKVVESDEEWDRCGKWILVSTEDGMDFADNAWKNLQPLLADGTLIKLKVSTAMLKYTSYVLCFTGSGLGEIRRAASAIRQVVDFRGCMFYKPRKLTRMGISNRIGPKRMGYYTYMHTYFGNFFKKDLNDRWVPDNEDDERNSSLTREFFSQNYSGFVDPLPSKTGKRVISLGDVSHGNPHWYLFCSYFEKDESLLPEVDRVWTVGARLLSERHIIGLSATGDRDPYEPWGARHQSERHTTGLRANKNESLGEVRLFVDRRSDVCSQLELCDRIFKEASIRGLIYYRKQVDRESLYSRPASRSYMRTKRESVIRFQQLLREEVMNNSAIHDYMCTSDGELYKMTKSEYEFVMSKSDSSHVPGHSAETRHVSRAEGDMSTNSTSCAMDNEDKHPPKQ